MFQQLKQLPANPNLRQLRIQAKELLKAYRSGDPEALSRIRDFHPRYPNASESEIRGAALLLSDAQLVIAHEYGFPSWPQLKRHLELGRTIQTARDYAIFSWGEDAVGYYEARAQELLNHHGSGLTSAVRRRREYLPRFAKVSESEIRASQLSIEEARLVIAQEIGFSTWDELIERAKLIGIEHPELVDEALKAAYEAVKSGDLENLKRILVEDPTVVYAFILGENYNSLLEVACRSHSKADEETRVQMIEILVAAGARLSCVPVFSSSKVLDVVIRSGAVRKGTDAGLWALKSALYHGHSVEADHVVRHGVQPEGFWMAAGVGDLERVKSYFDEKSRLKPEAGAYRPNLAEIGWYEEVSRSDDSQDIMEEALCIACLNGRRQVAEFLLSKGARLEAAPPGLGGKYTPLDFAPWEDSAARIRRQTKSVIELLVEHGANVNREAPDTKMSPLNWAAYRNELELVQYLLSKGANPNTVSVWGTTPLHYAVMNNNIAMVKAILDAGAPLDVRDKENNSTPLGWVKGTGADEKIADLLRSYGATE